MLEKDISIRKLGNKVLIKKSKHVKFLDINLVKDLSKTLGETKGVAIAAPQIGSNFRIFVVLRNIFKNTKNIH